jgi:hypothetical protein
MRLLVRRAVKVILAAYVGIYLLFLAFRLNESGEGALDQWGVMGWAVTGKASSATKALLWPYFLYSEHYSDDAPVKRELWRILPAIKAASAFHAEVKGIDGNPSRETLLRLISLKDTIVAVEPIDVAVLDRVYPKYGYMLRDKLFAAIKLLMDTSQTDRVEVTNRANKLTAEWRNWFDPRFDEIHARANVLGRD